MARRDEDESMDRDDDWEEHRRRNERRLRSDRDWFDPNQYGASGRYGGSSGYGGSGEQGRGSYGDQSREWSGSGRFGENRESYGQQRGYYSQQVAGRGSFGEGGWARNRPEESRWIETRQNYGQQGYGQQGFGQQGYGQQGTSPYAPITPRGGFSGKGPRGYVRSDERIREDVSDRLSWDDHVDASDITVTVSQGEVTLEGTVPDRMSKRRAEDITEEVMGVKDVHNRLKANKGLIQEVGDKLMGRETESTGHAGSGTRNQPASGSANAQNHR